MSSSIIGLVIEMPMLGAKNKWGCKLLLPTKNVAYTII
jgi:hypothetical protein